MKKVYGPIFTGKSMSPTNDLLKPSKSFTISELGFIIIPSMVSFDREFLGKTFNDDPISTKTRDKTSSIH